MPTYQYSCTDCGHFFEAHQSFAEDSLTVCPECEGRLRKVFNAVGVVFKGSGFYRTDSRTSQGQQDGAKSESAGSAGKGSESNGSEGKGSEGKGSEGTASKADSSSTPSPAA